MKIWVFDTQVRLNVVGEFLNSGLGFSSQDMGPVYFNKLTSYYLGLEQKNRNVIVLPTTSSALSFGYCRREVMFIHQNELY